MPTLPATGIPAGAQQPQQQEVANFLNLAYSQSNTLPWSTDTALREMFWGFNYTKLLLS